MPESTHQVSRLLANWQQGDAAALDSLVPLVYDDLRRIARKHLRRQNQNLSLESRALVHELYFKIPTLKNLRWDGRTHFLCVMSHLMRQVLVDEDRRRRAGKRHGLMLSLDEGILPMRQPEVKVGALDDALKGLEEFDPQLGRLVELRYFGGFSIEETAEALGVSPATVKRDWSVARAWLLREMARS